MKIQIACAIGTGSTLLSSFDSALQNAGVSNYNLLVLSSIIPPGSTIEDVEKYQTPEKEFGHKLYVIKADVRSDQKNEVIGAALGRYQFEDGRGFFVEHEVLGKNKNSVQEELKNLVTASVRDICTNRKLDFDENRIKIVTSVTKVEDRPACSLVIAVYKSEDWE